MPIQPANSTADLDPNIPMAEDAGNDDDLEGNDSPAKPIMLDKASAMSAGLTDAQPGSTWTVTLTIGDAQDDGSMSATIMPGSAEQGGEDEEVSDMPERKPRSRVLSPTEAGFSSDGNDM